METKKCCILVYWERNVYHVYYQDENNVTKCFYFCTLRKKTKTDYFDIT